VRINRHALTEWRENRGFSKSELAVAAGISLPYLCDLESGHRPGSPPVIARVADALKVNVFALIENPNEAPAKAAVGQ
jgi:transcriptional regulator with XRE-family HTH domain